MEGEANSAITTARILRKSKPINYSELVSGKRNFKNDEIKSTIKRISVLAEDNAMVDEAKADVAEKAEEDIKTEQVENDIIAETAENDVGEEGKNNIAEEEENDIESDEFEEDAIAGSNEYDLIRKKNLEEHEQFLRQLDFSDFKTEVPKTPKTPDRKRKLSSTSATKPFVKQRWSLRLQGKPGNESAPTESPQPFETDDANDKAVRNNDETIPMVVGESEEIFTFGLDDELEDISVSKYSTCSLSDYVKDVKKCQMWKEPTKILPKRITTLEMDRTRSNFILLAGDTSGHLSLWNIKTDTGMTFKPHSMQVNYVSFSKNDAAKFYSTSHDGIVRRGDVNSRQFDKIFSTSDESFQEQHFGCRTTWHDEADNLLYVAIGSGDVSIVDLRTNKVSFTVDCHVRSVRTVQLHPTNENYFLTSSGIGEIGVFDIRKANEKNSSIEKININPQGSATRGKGLTSAFFSPHTGNKIVTTCNDDTIRIYESESLQNISEIRRLPHNNHTGRWLSVFKAKWVTDREDSFYVGSLFTSKRFQLCHVEGKYLHNFTSDNMTTHCPVITVHPKLPLFVGGNSSGRIHVFSPHKELANDLI